MGSILTFGKYKWWDVEDIPDNYLEWLLEQDWLNPDLYDEIEEVMAIRTRSHVQVLE